MQVVKNGVEYEIKKVTYLSSRHRMLRVWRANISERLVNIALCAARHVKSMAYHHDFFIYDLLPHIIIKAIQFWALFLIYMSDDKYTRTNV